MMITIHQSELKSFQRRWHCQQISSKYTSLSSAWQIYHWPAHNSVNFEFDCSSSPYSSPSTNIPLFEKCNVLLSQVINNSTMNRIPISNSTYVQISCTKYIPPLCWIWPQFMQKSSLLYQQSHGMIQTCIPTFLKSPYSLVDKIRTTVQADYMHCSAKPVCNHSQFTMIYNSPSKLFFLCLF